MSKELPRSRHRCLIIDTRRITGEIEVMRLTMMRVIALCPSDECDGG